MSIGCDGRRSAFVKRASHDERIKLDELVKKINFEIIAKNEVISTIASQDGYRLVSERLTNGFVEFRLQSEEKTYGIVHLSIGKMFGNSKVRNIFHKSVHCGQIFYLR